jgi:hypothetical protein
MLKQLSKYLAYLFLSSLLVSASCNSRKVVIENEINAKTPVTITFPLIKDVSEIIELPSVSSYLVKNIIRSTTTGVIESVNVTPGEKVITGKLLFTMKTLEASAIQGVSAEDTTLVFKGIIKIVSTKDGVINEVTHQSGDFVQEGDELAVISDTKSLVFILDVPFEITMYIEKGKECSLKLPDNSLIRGKIAGKLPEMNVQDQTVRYIVNPDVNRQLPQNLIAVAGITKSIRKDAQVLPRNAILGNEIQTEFWVMKIINDSTAVKVMVKKGIENSDLVEIIGPRFLQDDRILVTGNYGLPDTAAIVIQ